MSRLLQPLRSLLFGPSESERVISQLQQKLGTVTAKLKESYDYVDTLIDPLERYRDGTDLYLPANGRLYDRKKGDQWPFLRTMYDLQNARGQSRAVTEGNGYGAGFLDRSVDFVVGDGHKPTVKLRGNKTGTTQTGVTDADGDGQPDIDPAVQKVEQFIDEFRELNGWGMGEEDREEEGFRRSQQDSEVFVRFFAGGAKTNGVPMVRWIDPEYVDEPPSAKDNEKWGIRTDPDDIETREAFWVKNAQDGLTGEWVDESVIVYHKLGTGRTVKRGFPLFFIVCEALWQCEKINRNLAEVSAIQAAIAYVRQHGAETLPSQIDELLSNNTDYTTKTRAGYRTGADRTVQVQWQDPGQVVDMSAGMAFEAGPASSGVANFVSALQSRLRQVCARFGYPEFFTSDASNNNYASILVSGGPFERNIKRRQRRYASFQEAVYKRALAYGVKAGRLSQDDVDAVQVCVEPPGVSIANQLEETQIRQIENQAGVLSVQTWMVKAGYDPKLEAANKEAWEEKFGGAIGQLPGGDGQDPNQDGGVDPGGDGGGADGGDNPFNFGGPTTEAVKGPGAPPFKGAVFDRSKHRWVQPNKDEPGSRSGGKYDPKSLAGVSKMTPDEIKAANRSAYDSAKKKSVKSKVPEKKPSAKALAAKKAHVMVDGDIQRYAEEHNEPRFAKAIGGFSFKDNEPVDVVLGEEGVVKHGIELKTMVINSNGKITMKRSAMERKAEWEKNNKATFHTVVLDDHAVKDALGPGQHDESKRVVYYRRGYGSFRVAGMHKVTGGVEELRSLMNMGDDELPLAAKRSAPKGGAK